MSHKVFSTLTGEVTHVSHIFYTKGDKCFFVKMGQGSATTTTTTTGKKVVIVIPIAEAGAKIKCLQRQDVQIIGQTCTWTKLQKIKKICELTTFKTSPESDLLLEDKVLSTNGPVSAPLTPPSFVSFSG